MANSELQRAAVAVMAAIQARQVDRTLPLLVASSPVRRARLAAREEAAFLAAWHERWGAAEAAYFTYVRPPESFDLVVTLDASPAAERDT